MINENFIGNGVASTLSSPGLIDPGIIVIAKTVMNSAHSPDGTGPAIENKMEIEEECVENGETVYTPTLIQYKADSNKFLGYIGDLAEYNFKHIPEKYYYNNIYPLELLNREDQDYLGSEQSILNSITEHSVFSELVGSDYKNPDSISPTNYDKFKPRYFGTTTVGNRTIVMLMVPPEYNTVFISNGSDVYSKKDYFKYYGILLEESLFHEWYEQMPSNQQITGGYSGGYVNGGTNPGNTTDHPTPQVVDIDQVSGVNDYVGNYIDPDTNPNPDPDPDTGGRGRGNGGHTTVASIADGFSLITDLNLGLELVVSDEDLFSTESAEIGDTSHLSIYDYWSPWCNYELKELRGDFNHGYKLFFKRKINLDTDTYRYFSLDNLLTESSLRTYISGKFKYGWLEAEEVISRSSGNLIRYRIPVYIKTGDSYRNLRGITKYTYELSSINQYRIYKKVTNYPGEEDDIRDVQCIEFTWDTSTDSLSEINCMPTTGPVKYTLTSTEDTNSVATLNVNSIFYIKGDVMDKAKIISDSGYKIVKVDNSIPITVGGKNGIPVKSTIKLQVGNRSYYYTIEETGWFIKENKQPQETNPYNPRDNTAHVGDTPDKDNFMDKTEWDALYGSFNYYKYLSDVSQLRFDIFAQDFKDYYKLIKIIFSSRESQNYSLIQQESSSGTVLVLEPGDTFLVGEDVLMVDYVWTESSFSFPNATSLDSIPNPKDSVKYFIGARIKVKGKNYSLTSYTLSKVSEQAIYSAIPGNIISIKVGNNDRTYSLSAETSSLAVESVNLVNIGYYTSNNPLKNIDKYLVKDTNFVKKYTTTNLGVMDLTSGTYISSDIREAEDESYVSFIRYSYRKTYKKGQTVLVGLPENLNKEIVDIQAFIPNIEKIDEENLSIGSVIYDYSSGKIYRIDSDTLEGIVDDEEYSSYNCNFTLSEPYLVDSENPNSLEYLFRYRNEYYLLQTDDEGNSELMRVGKLGIRTWISLCDENKGYLPGMSKNWMSRDGNLSVGDKIWVMVTSGNTQKRILGTIANKSSLETQDIGTCIKLACGILGSKVRINGTEVLVDNHSNIPQEYDGMKRYVYDIYMKRTKKVNGNVKEISADITNNLVFRDKINYLSNNYEN